jgi:hypothetical protein
MIEYRWLRVGYVHAGLNLHNDGFAAGMVASVLVPVVTTVWVRTDS